MLASAAAGFSGGGSSFLSHGSIVIRSDESSGDEIRRRRPRRARPGVEPTGCHASDSRPPNHSRVVQEWRATHRLAPPWFPRRVFTRTWPLRPTRSSLSPPSSTSPGPPGKQRRRTRAPAASGERGRPSSARSEKMTRYGETGIQRESCGRACEEYVGKPRETHGGGIQSRWNLKSCDSADFSIFRRVNVFAAALFSNCDFFFLVC